MFNSFMMGNNFHQAHPVASQNNLLGEQPQQTTQQINNPLMNPLKQMIMKMLENAG
jgi:hypothetical protein